MKIIKCKSGNIYGVLKEVEDVSLKLISCNSTDASFEKHIPCFKFDGDNVEIFVNHVMEEEHFIEWIMVEYKDMQIIKHFKPGDKPSVVVPYSLGMKAYSYCNKHSLWINDKIER